MAVEMLMRINRGLSTCWSLSIRDQQILYHFLFGRSAALTGTRLGLRETTVHKHLHRIYAKTGTVDRRGLIQLGLALAKQHGITPPPLPKRREVEAPIEAPIEDHDASRRSRLSA